MTVKDFGRASKEDDSYVVNVREHKTFHNYGHTQVVLTSNLQNWINVFIQEVMSSFSDIVPPTSLSSTTKALFSAEQVQTLLRLCENMIKANAPISKRVITKRLSNDIYGKQNLAQIKF